MADELVDLSVKELRARLKKHSLPTAGKKADLIKRLSVMVCSYGFCYTRSFTHL